MKKSSIHAKNPLRQLKVRKASGTPFQRLWTARSLPASKLTLSSVHFARIAATQKERFSMIERSTFLLTYTQIILKNKHFFMITQLRSNVYKLKIIISKVINYTIPEKSIDFN